MIFRIAASVVTLGMLVASAFASYAAVTMFSGEPTHAGSSVARLATPVGGEPKFVAPTPALTPAVATSPTPAH